MFARAGGRAARASARACSSALAALPGVTGLAQRRQHDPGARARRRARLRGHEGARRAGQERFQNAPVAGQLPAPDRRHRRRERADAGGPASQPYDHATAPPKSPATPRRRRSACASTSTAPARRRLATGIGFFDHMLDQIARHGLIDLDIEAKGDLHIDGHHTVEDVGITLGQAVAKAVGDKKGIRRYGHAYVPLDEALSRVVIDFSGRPGLVMDVPFKSGMIGSFDTQLALRVLPGLRQPRPRHAAHRQPARRERAPPVRDGVQGLRPRAAHGAGARSARGRHHSLHQGHASEHPVGDRARNRSPSSTTAWATCARCRRRCCTSPRAAGCRGGRHLAPRGGARRRARGAARPGRDARLHARAARVRPAGRGAARRPRTKPLFGVCVGMQMLLDHSEERPHRGLGLIPGEVLPLPAGGPAAARRQPLQGAADGLEPGLRRRSRHPLWDGIPDGACFYFVHSYYARPSDARHSAGETDYGARFTAALARDNIFATQFHPEKSADARPGPVPQLPALESLTPDGRGAQPPFFHADTSPMLLIPAIDLKDGHCVRLQAGRHGPGHHLRRGPGRHGAPLAVARGARRLHLVDLNGAFAGKPQNDAAITRHPQGRGRRDPGAAGRRHPRPRHHRALPRRRPALRDHRHRGGQEPRLPEGRLHAPSAATSSSAWTPRTARSPPTAGASSPATRWSTWPGSSRTTASNPSSTPTSAATACSPASTSRPPSSWRRR